MTILYRSHSLSSNKVFAGVLWVVFFCYAVSAALIFQKLLLPHMSSMLAPGSMLTTDATYFDSVALALADEIHKHGWSSWQLFPTGAASGNVALLGALYALFGHDPTLAIPLNAAFHAFGGVLIYLLAIELSPNRLVGRYAGIVVATLFVVFPSALNWYGQIHKDGYAIAGMLLVLWVWIKALKGGYEIKSWLWLAVANLMGILFIASIRPYYLKLLFVVVLGALIIMLAKRVISKSKIPWLFFVMVLITLVLGQKFVSSMGASQAQVGEGYTEWQSSKQSWHWRSSSWMPDFFEYQIETVARTRAGLIDYGKSVQASSVVDADIAPQSAGEVFTYIPRAFQVALLAPFPSSWGDKMSLARLLSVAEMSIIYVCLFGLFFLWRYHRSPAVLFAGYFASVFLIVYGVTIANVGTLYRVRYGFEFIFVLLGVVGWLTYLERRGILGRWITKIKSRRNVAKPTDIFDSASPPDRQKVVGAGLMVMILTFLGFLGFFVRDILMAHSFGLGAELDDFFVALMIPMFVVTVFCTPLGAAFVPFYTKLTRKNSIIEARGVVPHLSAITLGSLFLVCLLLYVGAPSLLAQLHVKEVSEGSGNLVSLMELALLILLFSGVVILGNATLSATQRLVLPSAAQMVVPIAAILGLVLFGSRYGVMSVMIGMIVGQLLNLLIVQIYLKKSGISLMPKFQPNLTASVAPLWGQYFPLLASAFFAGIVLPIDTMLAATLPEGNVSAFNLGTKVVLFISGLLGAVISSVMLPYFSTLVEKSGLHKARRELSLFLLMATFVSVPASVVLYIWAEPIVSLLFERGTFTGNDVITVSRVMQYAVIQIPFFACNILLLKYATATRHSVTITLTALVGLIVNVGVSVLLMPRMGASGIALAASVSMLIPSALLVIALVRFGHIKSLDAVVVLLNWMLFITLLVSIHFKSLSSSVMVFITYVILLIGYFKIMNQGKESFV